MSAERVPAEPAHTFESISDIFRENALEHGIVRFVNAVSGKDIRNLRLGNFVREASLSVLRPDRDLGVDENDPNPRAFRMGARFGITIAHYLYLKTPEIYDHLPAVINSLNKKIAKASESEDNHEYNHRVSVLIQHEGSVGLTRLDRTGDLIDDYIYLFTQDVTTHHSFKIGAGLMLEILAQAAEMEDRAKMERTAAKAAAGEIDLDTELARLLSQQ